jgi:hypothetical protein
VGKHDEEEGEGELANEGEKKGEARLENLASVERGGVISRCRLEFQERGREGGRGAA